MIYLVSYVFIHLFIKSRINKMSGITANHPVRLAH